VVLITAPIPFLEDLEGVSRGFSYVSGGFFENVSTRYWIQRHSNLVAESESSRLGDTKSE